MTTLALHQLTEAQKRSLRAACNRFFHASYHGGFRNLHDLRTGVIHSTDGGAGETAERVARYFAGPDAGGSTQLVVDDSSCYRCLPDSVVPYGAPGANYEGVHIEQVGMSTWSRDQWLSHWLTIHRAAYKMAVWAHWYGFPPVWLTVDDLKAGIVKGVTSHNNVSLAFHRSDHTDPGSHYPYDYFLLALRTYYKAGH